MGAAIVLTGEFRGSSTLGHPHQGQPIRPTVWSMLKVISNHASSSSTGSHHGAQIASSNMIPLCISQCYGRKKLVKLSELSPQIVRPPFEVVQEIWSQPVATVTHQSQ
ncbi:hypothetical protein BDA96_10G202100 [Sorghum bicolor]|uniref:Uncharacterized protein n=1 Tax=Sorghum bicolor TaxID=4558 RepID=A0A921Q481_SORBI|nr:hypothetical protein BDA96_10G202100 [Sorghum bicolor]